jgi:AmmeMemoRadiSam system protein B
MRKPVFWLIALTFQILLILWLLSLTTHSSNRTSSKNFGLTLPVSITKLPLVSAEGPAHPMNFLEEELFFQGVAKAKKERERLPYLVAGGVVPHHLLPTEIIARFFQKISFQKPKTVVLLGPNHLESGSYPVLTSRYLWETPFGRVEPEEEVVEALVNQSQAKIDEEVLANEHSVAGLMPFLKYYLPGSKVVPLVLSNKMSLTEVEGLVKSLQEWLNLETVIIASVDFSHYLTSSEAREKDEVSLAAVKSFNYPKIFTLNSEYLDSPSSIATLLMLMQRQETTNLEIFDHINSGEMLKDDSVPTTSYFSIAYY